MKKGKTFYLWLIIVIFVFLRIPYFQNIGSSGIIMFLNSKRTFVGLYPWVLLFSVIEGGLIVLYINSFIEDIKREAPKKFDL